MKQNVGNIDRFIRFLIGVAAIAVALVVTEGVWDIVLYVVGGLMLFTAAFGWCPLYALLHISTKKS